MNKGSYAGKIGNHGSMSVKAPFSQKSSKAPQKQTGGDLRSKGGKK